MVRNQRRRKMAKKPTPRSRGKKSAVKHGSSKPMLTTGALILTGIRTILSMIPGSTAIAEIADFVFKSIGMIKSSNISYNEYRDTVINVIGLGGSFIPTYVNIIGGSPIVERTMSTKNKTGIQWVNCEYLDAQLINVAFTATPSNPQSHRSGSWCISFTPFRSTEDETFYKAQKAVPEYITMSHMLGAVSGPANKPLTLSYAPGVRDGYSSQFHRLNSGFGLICISYEDLSRNSNIEFTNEEFSCDISMKGTVRVRTSYVTSDATGYSDDMTDVLTTVGAAVRAGGLAYQTVRQDGYKCTTKDGVCKFSGTVLRSFQRVRGGLRVIPHSQQSVEEELQDMELI